MIKTRWLYWGLICLCYVNMAGYAVDQSLQNSSQQEISFKKDEDLERNVSTSAERCLQEFLQKGGTFQSIQLPIQSDTEEKIEDVLAARPLRMQPPPIRVGLNEAIYPICSGGVCRSQTLWAVLQPFADKVILFPPHAARHGWDPYNGQINRFRNGSQENIYDEFTLCFAREKMQRFGFENIEEWKEIEASPTIEGLETISQFYDQYYFGPDSAWQGKKGNHRLYIAFSNNAHVTLHRLNQVNADLEGVTVIAIEAEDIITLPPNFLNTFPRSTKAYGYFASLLMQLFDFTEL